MTVRLSTALRNALASNIGFGTVFNRGSIQIYTGTQPATADSAFTGTLLGTATLSSGALTAETQATGTIVLTGGASGSINTVLVNTFNIIPDGAVPYNTSLNQTATDLAAAINRNGHYTATVSSATVTIYPGAGTGAAHNGYTVSAGLTTITATYGGGTISGGVSPVNGLTFGATSAGAITKSGTWSFNGVAAGTAGWFRLVGSVADASGATTTLPRLDGSIAVSGADLNLSNIVIASGAPNTIDSFTFTIPAQ